MDQAHKYWLHFENDRKTIFLKSICDGNLLNEKIKAENLSFVLDCTDDNALSRIKSKISGGLNCNMSCLTNTSNFDWNFNSDSHTSSSFDYSNLQSQIQVIIDSFSNTSSISKVAKILEKLRQLKLSITKYFEKSNSRQLLQSKLVQSKGEILHHIIQSLEVKKR
jgi:hypothetical protein